MTDIFTSPANDKQLVFLSRLGINGAGLTMDEAGKIIAKHISTYKTMSTTHHTPGPWLVIVPPSSSTCFRQIVADRPGVNSDTLLAEVIGGENVFQRVANARLIAAAPELLAALKTLLDVAMECGAECGPLTFAMQKAHAAIARTETA